MSRLAAPTSTESRGGRRYKVFLPAQVRGGQGVSRVHLLNLSATGALLHGDLIPAPGTVVQLTCAASTWLVRVVWAAHKRFGVVHVTPLAPRLIDALVAGQAG